MKIFGRERGKKAKDWESICWCSKIRSELRSRADLIVVFFLFLEYYGKRNVFYFINKWCNRDGMRVRWFRFFFFDLFWSSGLLGPFSFSSSSCEGKFDFNLDINRSLAAAAAVAACFIGFVWASVGSQSLSLEQAQPVEIELTSLLPPRVWLVCYREWRRC